MCVRDMYIALLLLTISFHSVEVNAINFDYTSIKGVLYYHFWSLNFFYNLFFFILSTASHSPKTRRKKLNARMKSFSLDTPEPPKQLLGIDETTKKKSSSFTNTCFGGKYVKIS